MSVRDSGVFALRGMNLAMIGLIAIWLISPARGAASPQVETPTAALMGGLAPRSTPSPTPSSTPSATPTATALPALDDLNAPTAYCGGIYRGDTDAGRNNVSRYHCQPGWEENGPELVYRIKSGYAQPLTVTLLHASVDLDLFLMRDVYPESCVAAGDTFLVYPVEPHDYLLVVDGYLGVAGSFTLRVDCPLEEQATNTPTFTPSPRPTATATPTPSTTSMSSNIYLPQILRYSR